MITEHVLEELGRQVADDGPAAHEEALQRLAALAAPLASGASAALAATSSPAVVRQRALAVVTLVLLRRDARAHHRPFVAPAA